MDPMYSKGQFCSFEGTQIRRNQPHGEQQKKQIRRRRQSRRPYTEMLLNMAEARREIVTALKIHRASMKESSERQQKQEHIKQRSQSYPCFESDGIMKSRRNPRIYPGCSYNCSCSLEILSSFSHVASPNAICLSSFPIAPSPVAENPNIELPIQTLGLNLNFNDFKCMDTADSSSFCLPSFSSSSYTCPTVSYATLQEVPKSIALSEEVNLIASDVLESNVPAGDSELQKGMTEKAMEIHEEPDMKAVEIDGHHTFDELMEFPDWLRLNDNYFQQQLNDQCSVECFLDPDLSCLDIGKIEDVDGEDWL